MTEMKVVLFSSLLCIMLGLGVIIGGVVALPLTNSAIDNLQTKASNYLQQAKDFLASAQNAINSTQVTLLYLSPSSNESLTSLADSGQLASNVAYNLTSVGSKMIGAGESLSNSSMLGATALASVGSTLTSIGQRINSAANSLGSASSSINSVQQPTSDRPNRLSTLNIQLDNLNGSLTDLQSSVTQAQSSLSSYFNPIRLVVVLGVGALMGLGAIFLLIGISIYTLRRRTFRIAKLP
jgi:hypothetical protein